MSNELDLPIKISRLTRDHSIYEMTIKTFYNNFNLSCYCDEIFDGELSLTEGFDDTYIIDNTINKYDIKDVIDCNTPVELHIMKSGRAAFHVNHFSELLYVCHLTTPFGELEVTDSLRYVPFDCFFQPYVIESNLDHLASKLNIKAFEEKGSKGYVSHLLTTTYVKTFQLKNEDDLQTLARHSTSIKERLKSDLKTTNKMRTFHLIRDYTLIEKAIANFNSVTL